MKGVMEMTPIEGAKACVARGWRVFPLRPRTKIPVRGVSWKKHTVGTIEDVDRMAKEYPTCNWAVDCEASGLMVVDLDCKNGIDGREVFTAYADSEFVAIPDTYTVHTPRGGKHLYFTGTGPSLTQVLDNVDTRGSGGYVVAPGSIAEGKEYVETGGTLQPLPAWVATVIGSCRRRADDQTPAVTQDSDASRHQAITEARALSVAVEGNGGDATTYHAACRMRDLGVSETVAYEILLTHYNPRCHPPWPDAQLAVKVGNAYRYAKEQPGKESPDTFGPVPKDEPEKKSTPTHVGKFTASVPPRAEWVVEGWIPRQGHTFFSGRGGVGKSTLCLQLAISVAAGLPWFGMQVNRLPVLVVACEDPEDEIHRRIHTITQTMEYAQADYQNVELHVWSRVGMNNLVAVIKDGEGVRPGKFHDELELQFKAMPPGPKFVVLDTIPDVFFGNENDRCSVNAFVKQVLGRWEKLYQVTFICTAHPPKSGAEFSGSTAWEGAFRARLFCEYADPERIDDYRLLRVGKSNYGKSGTSLTLRRHEDGLFRECADAEANEAAKTCVVAYVNECDTDGDPLCWSAQSPRCYYKQGIKDPDGKIMGEEVIKRLVREMIQECRLEVSTKNPRVLRSVPSMGDSV